MASTLSVLPNVIEKSERVAIVHGLAVSFLDIAIIVEVHSDTIYKTGLHPRR